MMESIPGEHSDVTLRHGVQIRLQDFAISLESKAPFRLPFSRAEEKIHEQSFFIVHPFSTLVPGSSLFAILGGSGSGKTTLLNVLAGRYDSGAYKVHGSISFSKPNCSIGYVTQADFLLPHLTVRETLTFTAKLKISPTNLTKLLHNGDISSPQEVSYEKLVESVIMDLGLKECGDSLIGVDGLVDGKRGISGGEKRRVSVGLQILTDPEVLCADEPTSGLDSFTAITLIESLKRLTKQSRKTTVVCSIHQPRADVFNIFDSALLLSKGGNAIYCGLTSQMIEYFGKIGYECPSDANPADFFVDLSSIDLEDGPSRDESIERVQKLITCFKDENGKVANHSEPFTSSIKSIHEEGYSAAFSQQYILLLRRFFINNFRDASPLYGSFIQAVIVGLIIAAIFWQLGDSQSDVTSRPGLMYITISMATYLTMIIFIDRYCREIKVLDRELQDELYHPVMYLLAHVTAMTPQMVLQSVIFSIPVYFGSGLRPGGSYFLMFVAVNITLCFVINGLTWMCLSFQRIYAAVSLLANLNFTFISLTAGFLVNFNTMPVYVGWVKYISFLSYAYKILMSNEFTDRTFGNIDGNAVLATDGIKQNDFNTTWPVVIAIGAAYYLIAAMALTKLRFPPNGSVAVEIHAEEELPIEQSKEQHNLYKALSRENLGRSSTVTRKQIKITVDKVNLFVQVTGNKKYKDGKKKILNNIHVQIQPGRLIALMGGSGSGKTTLLNLIANRIPQGNLKKFEEIDVSGNRTENVLWEKTKRAFTSEANAYFGTGDILFNGKRPSAKEVRHSVGYVPQFDYHLPSLTVSETLRYQAKLRLPLGTTEEELSSRVVEVLKTLGLAQCSGVRVGNEEKKGISGGEKRRLSIGIQLLSDPSICLFDEPTTGLDAFTARHIVQTLKSLAVVGTAPLASSEGKEDLQAVIPKRTVVLSIHQPRYDIFACVDDVTLLSRGNVVWSGPVKEMLEHFKRLGYPCPALVNPADFILDISSLDFRSTEKEEQSRAIVATLVNGFEDYRVSFLARDIEAAPLEQSLQFTDENGKEMIDLQHPAIQTLPSSRKYERIAPNEPDLLIPASQSSLSSKPDYFCFPLITHRSFTNLVRQPDLFYSRIHQGLFFGLILACFYAPVRNDQAYIQNRIGNIYELTAMCFIGMLNCIDIFPTERNVFYREYMDGIYSSYSFVLSFLVIAIPVNVIGSLCSSLLMACAIGLKPTATAIFAFTYCIFCFISVGECLGVIFCSAFSHIGFSLNIVSAVISFFCIMAGFISVSMPQFILDINRISPMNWGAYILANVVFEGETFNCDEESIANGTCLTTGDEVLSLYNFNDRDGKYGFTFHYWMLGIVTFTYFLVSIVAVRLKALKISH